GDGPDRRRLTGERDARAKVDLRRGDTGRRQRPGTRRARQESRGDETRKHDPLPHSSPHYDRVYNRLVSGRRSRRKKPPTPVGRTSMTRMRTAPKTTLEIPCCFGSTDSHGRWLAQRATASAWLSR